MGGLASCYDDIAIVDNGCLVVCNWDHPAELWFLFLKYRGVEGFNVD